MNIDRRGVFASREQQCCSDCQRQAQLEQQRQGPGPAIVLGLALILSLGLYFLSGLFLVG